MLINLKAGIFRGKALWDTSERIQIHLNVYFYLLIHPSQSFFFFSDRMPFENNQCKNLCTVGRFPQVQLQADDSLKGACCAPVYTNPDANPCAKSCINLCVNPCANVHVNPCIKACVNPRVNPCINPCATPYTNPCSVVTPCRDYETKEVVIKECMDDCTSKQVCGDDSRSRRSLSCNA